VCKDGANVWLTISLSRAMPDHARAVIDQVIQRNAYFAHPENLLLVMTFDERDDIRQLGLRRILCQQQKTGVRKFVVITPINFEAGHYMELIDWVDVVVTIPPLLAHILTDKISGQISEDNDAMLPVISIAMFKSFKE